jgi:hypothetical protein
MGKDKILFPFRHCCFPFFFPNLFYDPTDSMTIKVSQMCLGSTANNVAEKGEKEAGFRPDPEHV